MRTKQAWTLQSFLTCFLLNAALIGVLFYAAKQIIMALRKWVDPFLVAGSANLQEDFQLAFSGLDTFLKQVDQYLAPALFGLGGLVTLLLWLFVMLQGRGLIKRVSAEVASTRPAKSAKAAKKAPEAEPQYVQATPQAAVQMLSVLQCEGRLIDFLQEDLALYEDAQIGAAVRGIHQGCRDALKEYVDLKPILEQGEGEEVTVLANFDSKSIRLTGNVAGEPPFKGILRHRGWKIVRLELPKPTAEQQKDWVLAPAEVEIGS